MDSWRWSTSGNLSLVLAFERALTPLSQLTAQISAASLYDHLRPSLLSHSRRLRLATLRLLSSTVIQGEISTETLKQCLQAEEVTIDVRGVRERVMRISRMNHILKEGDEIGSELAVRWLIGSFDLLLLTASPVMLIHIYTAQLKVNLRPLWSPTADALSAVSERFGDTTWNLLFEELKAASIGQMSEPSPDWMHIDDSDGDTISETERTWRDPSAHKLRSSVAKRLRGNAARHAIVKVSVFDGVQRARLKALVGSDS